MSIIKLVQTVTQNRSPEIAHTKLPKWSLWDFIDVGKDRRLLASQRTKGKIFGRRSLTFDNHLDDSRFSPTHSRTYGSRDK